MRILIADDDPVSRAVLARILSAHPGYDTTIAADGLETWSLLDDPSRNFDVLFLDLNMPKLDGFELLRRIRETLWLKSIEVIVCTSSNDRETVMKVAQVGARQFIVKPCSEAVVMAKLRQLQSVSAGRNSVHPFRK